MGWLNSIWSGVKTAGTWAASEQGTETITNVLDISSSTYQTFLELSNNGQSHPAPTGNSAVDTQNALIYKLLQEKQPPDTESNDKTMMWVAIGGGFLVLIVIVVLIVVLSKK